MSVDFWLLVMNVAVPKVIAICADTHSIIREIFTEHLLCASYRHCEGKLVNRNNPYSHEPQISMDNVSGYKHLVYSVYLKDLILFNDVITFLVFQNEMNLSIPEHLFHCLWKTSRYKSVYYFSFCIILPSLFSLFLAYFVT